MRGSSCCIVQLYEQKFLSASCEARTVAQFAQNNDLELWCCFSRILNVDFDQCEAGMKVLAILFLSWGGLGLRSATRTRVPAHWSSWADCFLMVFSRHRGKSFGGAVGVKIKCGPSQVAAADVVLGGKC